MHKLQTGQRLDSKALFSSCIFSPKQSTLVEEKRNITPLSLVIFVPYSYTPVYGLGNGLDLVLPEKNNSFNAQLQTSQRRLDSKALISSYIFPQNSQLLWKKKGISLHCPVTFVPCTPVWIRQRSRSSTSREKWSYKRFHQNTMEHRLPNDYRLNIW